jgi:hypothetical protein
MRENAETWTAPSWVVDTVEAYMQALGLNKATIEFTLSTTEPTDMIYLTENDAKRLGLAVAIVPGPVTASSHLITVAGRRDDPHSVRMACRLN